MPLLLSQRKGRRIYTEEYYTVRELAEYTKTTVQNIHDMFNRWNIQKFKIGNTMVVRAKDIEKLLLNRGAKR